MANVSVSVDGAWQKRYGFNSLVGMVFVISIDTGQVLDYVVKCLFCQKCKSHKNATDEWKSKHKAERCVNHEGSSGAMEKEGTIEMFLRSIEKHQLQYTIYVGDGDSSSFGAVKDALHDKYGDEYPLIKEDCIGHIQKSMGTALRKYKNNCCGSKLSDGKTVGGTGRLTDAVIDHIQTYYGCAIRNNKSKKEEIVQAIWAIYYHMVAGPLDETLDEQHRYCPNTSDTWCKYHKDVLDGTNYYQKGKCLPHVFRDELKSIFEKLSSNDLLDGCQRGLTQNQNESINSIVWSRCPKQLFCGKHRFTISVCDAVTQFNDGAKGRKRLYKTLNLNVGINAIKGLQREEKKPPSKSVCKGHRKVQETSASSEINS